jgi:hypothetical protein
MFLYYSNETAKSMINISHIYDNSTQFNDNNDHNHNNSNNSNDIYSDETSSLLLKIILPFLLIIGFIGNSLSIYIFSRPLLIRYTTFRYLTWISFLDLGALLFGCTEIILMIFFNFHIRLASEIFCKLQPFFVIFFTQTSSMMLAIMSIDRTIVITLKNVKFNSTPKTADLFFLILSAMFISLNFHLILFMDLIDVKEQQGKVLYCYGSSSSVYYKFLVHINPL